MTERIDRRRFLRTAAVVTGTLALSGCKVPGQDADASGGAGVEFGGRVLTSAAPLPKPFTVPLPVPPVKRPIRSTAYADFFDLTAEEAEVEILPGLRTRIMGYDGIFPGPTIRTRRGRKAVLRYRNKLGVPTVVHLHGGHTPAESDGFPTDLVLPVAGGSGYASQAVGGWVINGKEFDPRRIDASPRLGEVEIWRLATDAYHPVHIHLSPFQVISRNGGPPGAGDQGWKDTIDLNPEEYADVAIRFDDYTGRYLLHCHNLEHEDMAMMATFQTGR